MCCVSDVDGVRLSECAPGMGWWLDPNHQQQQQQQLHIFDVRWGMKSETETWNESAICAWITRERAWLLKPIYSISHNKLKNMRQQQQQLETQYQLCMHTVPIPLVCLFQKASFRRASECCVVLFWWHRARKVYRELDLAPPLTFELSLLLLVLRSTSMAKAKNSSSGTNVFDFTFTIEISSCELKWNDVWVKRKNTKKKREDTKTSHPPPPNSVVCLLHERKTQILRDYYTHMKWNMYSSFYRLHVSEMMVKCEDSTTTSRQNNWTAKKEKTSSSQSSSEAEEFSSY